MKLFLLAGVYLSLSVVSFNANALTKSELFSQLLENNLMLKEEQSNLQVIEATSVTVWPSPELALSEMNAKTPFIDGEMKMQRSVEISQMFPNPLKISADKQIKNNSESVQRNQVKLTFKKVKTEAYNLFLGIYQNQKEFEILSFKKNQLEKFLERLKSSQVQAQEEKIQIGEAKLDLDELKLNLALNLSEYKRMKNMLNQMLNLDLEATLSDPILDEIVFDKKIDTTSNSELKILESKINLMEADLSMKKSEFYPEFNVKVKMNKSYSALIEDSKEVMVGFTLPFLFWGQQTNGVNVARFKIEAMKHAKNNQIVALKSKSETLRSEIDDLLLTLKFLKESSLAIKEKKMKLFSNYSYTDMKTLMNYKMSFDDIYMIKMKILAKELELQKKYFEWTELEG